MSEKEILINSLTEKSNKKGPNKCGKQKSDKSENMNLDKLYHQKRDTELVHLKTLKMNCQIKKRKTMKKSKHYNTVIKWQYTARKTTGLTLS